jgi:FkbM family methyltransferase
MTDFSNIPVAPVSGTQERGVAWLNFGSRRVRLTFPDAADIRQHINRIVSGQEYPALQLPGYEAKTILDIGANVGAATLYFHFSFPQAEVYAFEPGAENFRHLAENTRDFPRIHAFQCGLLDRAERVPLYAGKLQSMQCSIVPGPETTSQSQEIELRSAREEISRLGLSEISILKLDTEGCEVPILHSLQSHLDAIDFIYVEYHSEEDRREIDRMTAKNFLLTRSHALSPHRGQVMYSNNRVASQHEIFNRQKVVGPRPLNWGK